MCARACPLSYSRSPAASARTASAADDVDEEVPDSKQDLNSLGEL